MNSSTSSSSLRTGRGVRAIGIALMLLGSLAILEGLARTVLVRASKDLSRFETYDARAAALVAAPRPRVALVGNSTTERGVDLGLLRRAWRANTGEPLSVDMFVADASAIRTWYWMTAQEFWGPRRRPDLLVVIYYGTGLTDTSQMEIGRIARYFSDAGDWQELFAHDLPTLEQRADYLVASRSQLWATRDRIRERVLTLVPGYERFATTTNAVIVEDARRREAATGVPPRTHDALQRFLDRARRAGMRVCLVAFPSLPREPGGTPYALAPEALEAIADAGMVHLDLRYVDGLSPADYQDAVHLNADGQAVFTARLAEELARIRSFD